MPELVALPPAPDVLPYPRPAHWRKGFKLFGFVMSDDEYVDWLAKNVKFDIPPGREPTRGQLISTARTYCSSLILSDNLGIARLVWPADEQERKDNPYLRLVAFAMGTNRTPEDLKNAYDVERIRKMAEFLGKDKDAMPQWYTFAPY